jgi:hypothetical protein
MGIWRAIILGSKMMDSLSKVTFEQMSEMLGGWGMGQWRHEESLFQVLRTLVQDAEEGMHLMGT